MFRSVLVDESGNLSELQRRKGHVRRGRRQFRRAVTGGAKAELVEVDAFPTHRGLEHAVQPRRVQAEGTSTRRHTIGLMPSNHTLTCTIAFASVADGARFSVGRGCFGRRVIQIDY